MFRIIIYFPIFKILARLMFAHVIKGFCLCIGQIPKTRQKEHY